MPTIGDLSQVINISEVIIASVKRMAMKLYAIIYLGRGLLLAITELLMITTRLIRIDLTIPGIKVSYISVISIINILSVINFIILKIKFYSN